MQREIQLTADGSHTVAIPEMNITYHSRHGAIGESLHVFIEAGLLPLIATTHFRPIHILEMGFGTGLNAILSWREAIRFKQPVYYQAIELFPLSESEAAMLNYDQQLNFNHSLHELHAAAWNEPFSLDPLFTLHKMQMGLLDFSTDSPVHCIYFDAFSPDIQPELWTQEVFRKLFDMLAPSGRLVTYCSKTVVRKAMAAAGFRIEKIPGPYGKREMVRAIK